MRPVLHIQKLTKCPVLFPAGDKLYCHPGFTGYRAEFSFKHQVELADVGQLHVLLIAQVIFVIFYQFFKPGNRL